MANSLHLQLQILLLLLILISFFISAASFTTSPPPPTATAAGSPQPESPAASPVTVTPARPPPPVMVAAAPVTVAVVPGRQDQFLYSSILSTLGFSELSAATAAANLSTTTPITIFAPSDTSLLTCPSCSLPLLLQEHSVPGLYPLHFLRNLAFGTKLETLAPNRCLTITSTTTTNTGAFSGGGGVPGGGGDSGGGAMTEKVFVNGIEITSPDKYNNGLVMVHGLEGFVTHLSPISCNVERMTSLAFPPPSMTAATSFSIMRLMLKDAIVRLRSSGYSFVALALRLKYAELVELRSMTIFALDDAAIFAGEGLAYLSHFRFHVVPNRRIAAADLVSLPAMAVLPTLESGQKLVVTTAGGGGKENPMKVNYVKISSVDLLHNGKICVHGVSVPFPHMHHHNVEANEGFGTMDQSPGGCDPVLDGGVCMARNSPPVGDGFGFVGDLEDHHGL